MDISIFLHYNHCAQLYVMAMERVGGDHAVSTPLRSFPWISLVSWLVVFDGLVSVVMERSRVDASYPQLLSTVGQPEHGGMSRNRTRSKHDIIEHDLRERAEFRSQVTVGGRGDCQAGQEPMTS